MLAVGYSTRPLNSLIVFPQRCELVGAIIARLSGWGGMEGELARGWAGEGKRRRER